MTELLTTSGGPPDGGTAPEPTDRAERKGTGVPAPVPTVAELIDFELDAPSDRGAKARAIRRRFGWSTGRYHQALHHAIESETAARERSTAVMFLRRELEGRRMRRALSSTAVPASAGHHRSTRSSGPTDQREDTMDGQTDLALAAPGEAEKQRGMALATEAAEYEWKERVDEAIRRLATGGEEFTADDVREIAGDPPTHPNAMGGRFFAAAIGGVIRRTGYAKSKRPSLHAHPIAVWIGTRGDAVGAESSAA